MRVSGVDDNERALVFPFSTVLLLAQDLRAEEDKTVRLREALWQEGTAKREWETTTEVRYLSVVRNSVFPRVDGTRVVRFFFYIDARAYVNAFARMPRLAERWASSRAFWRWTPSIPNRHSLPLPPRQSVATGSSNVADLKTDCFFFLRRACLNFVSCRLRQASRVLKQRLESTERIRKRQQVQ